MAQLVEQYFVIKMSKLLKDSDSPEALLSDEIMEAMENIIEELVSDSSVIIEVTKSDE